MWTATAIRTLRTCRFCWPISACSKRNASAIHDWRRAERIEDCRPFRPERFGEISISLWPHLRGPDVEVHHEAGTVCQSAVYLREFRYSGGGRQRYWSRERNPDTFAPIDDGEGWREYLGESIYADLTVNENTGDPNQPLTASAGRRYLHAGDGRLIGWREAGLWYIVHADHLGSTRLVTQPTGGVGWRGNYAAFGEVLKTSNPGGAACRSRYGWCGGWGYEDDGLAEPGDATLATGLLHVCAWCLCGCGAFSKPP